MINTIICWNKTIDADFRTAYAATVTDNEQIQDSPAENADQTWHKVGSWRITQEQANALKATFGDDMSIGEPEGWVDYQEPDLE